MSEAGDFIPLSVPHIQGGEWDYVKSCLDTGWVSTAGPFVTKFEKDFAAYVGAKHAVACSSGSAALHVALLLAGVKPGDLVLVPTLTFIASVNAIRLCGAEPLFLDCDDFYNLDPGQTTAFLREECRPKEGKLFYEGRRVAAVLPVHVFGNAADLGTLLEECEAFDLPIVEDAAESLGSSYRPSAPSPLQGRHTGTLGRLGCFSFNGNKIATCGGGGMIVTDDPALATRAKYLTTQAKDDEARFVHHEIGFNYRLTNVQAAIGLAQLEQMEKFRAKKEAIFQRYKEGLGAVAGLRLAPTPAYALNNCWMPALQVEAAAFGEDREALMLRLEQAKIQTRPVWELNHRQRPYLESPRLPTPRAERLHQLTLNLPCSVGLTEAQQARVIREIRRG